MSILVTGGTGFIGSHTCVELLNAGYNIIIIDNLSNSKIQVIDHIKKITGKSFQFYQMDMLNKVNLDFLFQKHKFTHIIHFAGLKSVSESNKQPLLYYSHNLTILFNLLEVMEKYNCHNIIFSSSATVYTNQNVASFTPYNESETPIGIGITNAYGQTKYMQEKILDDLYKSNNKWNITILRYFNPVGSHTSGLLTENPNGFPNNLMPYIVKTAKGEYKELNIFGSDYETRDGTCIRDFIHVVDLAKGHIQAIKKIKGFNIYNLGTGKGTSVLEIIKIFEKVHNIKLNYIMKDRRTGDVPISYANVDKAKIELEWQTEKTIENMCRDSYLQN
ncbi:MAG: UDP-glucose 4-epimerase GalE [Edafosvirus sp.]|uniref:UDP-glucose 4-epimerase n=1 Tax=Edafosvirus sp. TaxID=2487765 RepID=A0A3G4ZXL6_9VIRU|nr:MAG: UDP-glucose 4-epimerase GalE [Edafosvirus sp.]